MGDVSLHRSSESSCPSMDGQPREGARDAREGWDGVGWGQRFVSWRGAAWPGAPSLPLGSAWPPSSSLTLAWPGAGTGTAEGGGPGRFSPLGLPCAKASHRSQLAARGARLSAAGGALPACLLSLSPPPAFLQAPPRGLKKTLLSAVPRFFLLPILSLSSVPSFLLPTTF